MTNNPWKNTKLVNSQYLGIMKIRPVPTSLNDKLYVIENQYMYRPDLLAYDLYDDYNLWWVFAQRNLDVIKDPIYDFKPGVEIYLPSGNNIRSKLR